MCVKLITTRHRGSEIVMDRSVFVSVWVLVLAIVLKDTSAVSAMQY